MGLDMDVDFDKQCRVGLSPTTVLPLNRRSSNVESRSRRSKLTRRDELLTIDEDFTEISFGRHRSTSCKSIPYRPVGLEGNAELKRGSVYQSSREVRNVKKLGIAEGRKKIEMSRSNDTSFSFRIADTLCSLDEESSKKRLSLNSDLNKATVSKPQTEPHSSDGFFEIRLNSDNREDSSAKTVERDSNADSNMRSDEVVGPRNDGNELLERDTVRTLHKSSSAKAENGHPRTSQKSRFRKMFDPFTKSKSLRSPLGFAMEHGDVETNGTADIRKNGTFRKSLLHDFSNTEQNLESQNHFAKKDNHHSVVAYSPAHLHGCLKVENKHGVPFFEFSLKCPEDVFVAKTWKVDNSFNWVYTFHSIHSRRKSNAYGRISKDSNKESSMVGQMQVSSYLRSEQKDEAFDNSMVTEFVLYDIAHARKSDAAQKSSNCSPDISKPPKSSNESSLRETQELDAASDPVKLKSQTPYPWPQADLHPTLEIAAIVIQIPFEKRESLKNKKEDKISDKGIPDFLDCSVVGQRKKDIPVTIHPPKMNVVTPSGIHGLPNAENQGPSSLLDRWRLNGACDCGGWDMACPLTVFCDSSIQNAEENSFTKNQWPLQFHVQGGKENIPALTITVVEEGQYAVDFHAQLSTLQAFSICVAIMHSSEASTVVRQEGNKQLLQCNSLKVLIEDEVKFLIESVTGEEKRKITEKAKQIPPSFVLNPPFSPIARV